jgi:hypothetical protein
MTPRRKFERVLRRSAAVGPNDTVFIHPLAKVKIGAFAYRRDGGDLRPSAGTQCLLAADASGKIQSGFHLNDNAPINGVDGSVRESSIQSGRDFAIRLA